MRVNFWGAGWLEIKERKKNQFEIEKPTRNAKKKQEKIIIKLCNGANNVQIRVWRRDEICFFLFVF
jgi:hypothetical protein